MTASSGQRAWLGILVQRLCSAPRAKRDSGLHLCLRREKIRFATAEELKEAFLYEDDRKVDRTGCLKLNGHLYNAGPALAGKKVEIRFGPCAADEVEIWRNGKKECTARELALNQPRQGPETKPAQSPGRSRYLDALA